MKRDLERAFHDDVLAGLAAPIPAVPSRWFYDRRGSELFEQITRLPEYYPTRTERALLAKHAADVARAAGAGTAVIEFGSGSSKKTEILLDRAAPAAYVPIDISGEFLLDAVATLRARFPSLAIYPVEGDFMKPIVLPREVAGMKKLGFFPGSTIGNLVARTAVDLLRALKETVGPGAFLVIGMDRIKDEAVLLRAYNDAQGVTAAFNLNLLARINRELKGTIPIDAFRHRAIWNDTMSRIEMHLEARRDVEFTVAGQPFRFARGSTIHTENSHKYGLRDGRMLLRAAGWGVRREWTDPDEQFALVLAEAEPPRFAP